LGFTEGGLSIRLKVILPYLLLTLVVAVTGVYVVTRLVASSLSERLTNQLLESGRVVSDGMARQDMSHLEAIGVIAYTSGMAEALNEANREMVYQLGYPAAVSQGVENLIIVDRRGQEHLFLVRQADGSYQSFSDMGTGSISLVQELLKAPPTSNSLSRGIGENPVDDRYYYYTAAPVTLNNQVAGVVMVGTSLDTIAPYLKSISLADVIIYFDQGSAISTTLGAMNKDRAFVSGLSIPLESYLKILSTRDIVTGETIEVDGRSYNLARGALRVSGENIGAFAVTLPLNFVLQKGADSRNLYVALFLAAMLGVILMGYLISRLIINPLYKLVSASQAIADGNLSQRSGVKSKDEIGLLANTFDTMTARLQTRTAELRRTYRILEQMDRTKSNFIEVSAHELRTPLTIINGYTEMLKLRSSDDPDLLIMSNGILDGYERIIGVVNSMLDVSKIDSQTLKVSRSPVQANLLIHRVQKNLQQALEERKITFVVHPNLDRLPPFWADPELLNKVFYQIIVNAIKYTPDGGVIRVNGRMLNHADRTEVELVVRDTGIGIAPQHQELIFEKFFQTGEVRYHSTGKTKFKGGGPGLGLAIAKGIVEAHHGRIWAVSAGYNEETCPGSAFYVRLPCEEPKI
jgi:signal transduction histidine kinase